MACQRRHFLAVFTFATLLLFAGPSRADTLTFSFDGTAVSGSGSMQATAQGNGSYLVTSITGSVDVGGLGGAITGLIPTGGTGFYLYDNLVYPNSSPQLDYQGVVFSVAGFTNPMNLCADPACNLSSGSQSWLIDNVNGYNFYPVEFAVKVPEPRVLAMLALGLVAVLLLPRAMSQRAR